MGDRSIREMLDASHTPEPPVTGSFENVTVIDPNRYEVNQLGLDIVQMAETGEIEDALVVFRRPDNTLDFVASSQDRAKVAELALFLLGQNLEAQKELQCDDSEPG